MTFVEQSKAADGVAARAAADTEVKRTRKEFFGSCNVADLEMFAARTAGYERSNPPMLAEMADATEKMKFSNEKATAAAIGYAKALRDKGTVLKNGKNLDAQLQDLVEKSATTRGAFTDARTAVKAADAALETTCTSAK